MSGSPNFCRVTGRTNNRHSVASSGMVVLLPAVADLRIVLRTAYYDRPGGAAGQVRRRAGRSACAPTATSSTSSRRAIRPLPRRHLHRPGRARAALRRGDRRVHRRRFRRAGHRCPPQAGRHRRRAHHRQGRRRRRQLVLEPLSRRAVRHGGVHLPAAARGDRPHAEREVHARARDPRALPAHRQALRPVRQRLSGHRGHRGRVGRRRRTAGSSAPTAATRCGPSTSRMGTGPLHRPKLPGIPGIETFAGHSFHTSRWDYAYTGGDRPARRWIGLADKRVGIIGTGATSVQCIPHLARSRRRAVRVPAHAVVDRHPQQPADRPRVVRHARAGLAGASG